MNKLPLYESFKDKWSSCKDCGLWACRTQVVFGQGNLNSPIMIIGEAPGEEEDLSGIPFNPNAPAGSLLTKILEAEQINIKREHIYISNTCLCRPWDNLKNRAPSVLEMNACSKRLVEEIDIVKPQILVLCGNTPLKLFYGQIGISKLHGKLPIRYVSPNHRIDYVFATFHPAAFLYGSTEQIKNKKLMAWDDWLNIATVYHTLAGKEPSEKDYETTAARETTSGN